MLPGRQYKSFVVTPKGLDSPDKTFDGYDQGVGKVFYALEWVIKAFVMFVKAFDGVNKAFDGVNKAFDGANKASGRFAQALVRPALERFSFA